MTRHPLEGFVKAELAYRADPWNPGLHDDLGIGNSWRGRRLGRLRRGRSRAMGVTAAPASELSPAPGPQAAPARLAIMCPLPGAPRRPDAA